MPRVARAPAIPPPPPLPALSLVLTGKVFVVKMRRVVTPRPVSVNNLGRFCLRPFKFSTLVNKMGFICLPSYPQTADLPHPPSTPEAVFPDGHLSKQGTIHARGLFPGRSPLPTGDRPRWDLFSQTVAPSNRGPSMLGAIFPDGHLSKQGTVHAGGRFSGQSACGA